MRNGKICEKDFKYIADHYNFSILKNTNVFITGATGLLGSQIICFIDYLNEKADYNTRIFALVRNMDKGKMILRSSSLPDMISLVEGDIKSDFNIMHPVDYIIHGASITESKEFIRHAVETIDIAVNGTINVLEFSRKKNVKSVVYLSSMEAFGITDGNKEVREENLGYIDILNTRSSYPESKRMCECLCASYAEEYNVPVKMVRLSQTFGPGIAYNDTRVAAQFARAVIESQDIILKTEGKTKRPVLYTRDAVSAVLTVLLRGENGKCYTAANPETFKTIRETAEMVAEKIAQNHINVTFNIDNSKEYAPNLNLNLNIDKLRSLGWKPSVGLEEAYRNMIETMRENT